MASTQSHLRAMQRRGRMPRHFKFEVNGHAVHVVEDVNQPSGNMRVSPDLFEAMLQGVLDGKASQKAKT